VAWYGLVGPLPIGESLNGRVEPI